MKRTNALQQGEANALLVVAIVLAILVLGSGAFGFWAYSHYLDQKNNVDQKVSAAVSTAKLDQQSADSATFTQQEKQPNRQFVGPDALGRVTFNYPKTWSLYVAQNGIKTSTYQSYFYPISVPSITDSSSVYALTVSVLTQRYSDVLGSYQSQIKTGGLTATAVKAEGETGVRLDGTFSNGVVGAMVIYQLRDTTLEVATQSPTFLSDFNNTIVPSLGFNK